MELSRTILNGISLSGNAHEISDEEFKLVLQDIFKLTTSSKLPKGTKCELETLNDKIAHSCLLSLLLEACKHDVDVSSLSSVFEECKWESNRISSFLNLYQKHKDEVQAQLSRIGDCHDHIVDVKWRQDFIVKSNNCEKISEPSYLISLKTLNPTLNDTKDVTFSCNLEQLQDLVLKLKDATKCIERNAV